MFDRSWCLIENAKCLTVTSHKSNFQFCQVVMYVMISNLRTKIQVYIVYIKSIVYINIHNYLSKHCIAYRTYRAVDCKGPCKFHFCCHQMLAEATACRCCDSKQDMVPRLSQLCNYERKQSQTWLWISKFLRLY